MTNSPMSFAVCMGMDALRICIGKDPVNFPKRDVLRWILAMCDKNELSEWQVIQKSRPE